MYIKKTTKEPTPQEGKKIKVTGKYSGVHLRVSTIKQPSFEKKKCDLSKLQTIPANTIPQDNNHNNIECLPQNAKKKGDCYRYKAPHFPFSPFPFLDFFFFFFCCKSWILFVEGEVTEATRDRIFFIFFVFFGTSFVVCFSILIEGT